MRSAAAARIPYPTRKAACGLDTISISPSAPAPAARRAIKAATSNVIMIPRGSKADIAFAVVSSSFKRRLFPRHRPGGWGEARSGTIRRRSGRRCKLQLSEDHPLQRFDRLEILRRDLRLRDREIEFRLHAKHQIDHVHRRQSDVHQQRFRSQLGRDRILFEDRLDESKDAVLNIGIDGLHLQLPPVVPIRFSLARALSNGLITMRFYNSANG